MKDNIRKKKMTMFTRWQKKAADESKAGVADGWRQGSHGAGHLCRGHIELAAYRIPAVRRDHERVLAGPTGSRAEEGESRTCFSVSTVARKTRRVAECERSGRT